MANRERIPPRHVLIVSGEQSGDVLGAGVIERLRRDYPDCQFVGIGGEHMQAAGLRSLFPMERLSVMGFVDPLKRLPELLSILRHLKRYLSEEKPDMFIGIDAPDFNLRVERRAKELGIFSVHYVSPSVWAWRQGRIKKIKKAVDLMLCLLPFEAAFYRQHQVPVCFVGHPLADELPMHPDRAGARAQLDLDEHALVCALMPGSRRSEVSSLLSLMLETARELKHRHPQLQCVLPAANPSRLEDIQAVLGQEDRSFIRVQLGESHTAMTAADLVIMASGTTTLEAMLLKRPMIILYKWPTWTWRILKRMVKVPWVGLPNLLAQRLIAPELLQDDATLDKVLNCAEQIIGAGGDDEQTAEYYRLHESLRRDAVERACNAILEHFSNAKHE